MFWFSLFHLLWLFNFHFQQNVKLPFKEVAVFFISSAKAFSLFRTVDRYFRCNFTCVFLFRRNNEIKRFEGRRRLGMLLLRTNKTFLKRFIGLPKISNKTLKRDIL